MLAVAMLVVSMFADSSDKKPEITPAVSRWLQQCVASKSRQIRNAAEDIQKSKSRAELKLKTDTLKKLRDADPVDCSNGVDFPGDSGIGDIGYIESAQVIRVLSDSSVIASVGINGTEAVTIIGVDAKNLAQGQVHSFKTTYEISGIDKANKRQFVLRPFNVEKWRGRADDLKPAKTKPK